MPPMVSRDASVMKRTRKSSTCDGRREGSGKRGWAWAKAGRGRAEGGGNGQLMNAKQRFHARRCVSAHTHASNTPTHTQSTGKERKKEGTFISLSPGPPGMAASAPPPSVPAPPPPPPSGSRRLPIYTKLAPLPGLPPPLPPSSLPPPIPTLVPIRIDIDFGGIHLIDSFSIDPHDSSLTPEQWARQLCVDLELPAPQEFERRIAQSIR